MASPIEQGRLLASLIPDCRFVQLDSENHMLLADEPAWARLYAEVRDFLAEPTSAPAPRRNSLALDRLHPLYWNEVIETSLHVFNTDCGGDQLRPDNEIGHGANDRAGKPGGLRGACQACPLGSGQNA